MSRTETRVAFIGGGRACRDLLQMIQADPHRLGLKVVAVADPDPTSAGVTLAREAGIPTTADYHELLDRPDLDLVVELTGREDVRDDLLRWLPPHIHLIDHYASRFFWDFLALSEESIRLRRQTEQRILAERNRLRHVLDSLPYEILVIDKDYVVEAANRTFLENNGLTVDQVVGRYCYDIEHRTKAPCEVSVLGCPHAESLQAGEAVATIVSQVDEDGSERFAAVRAAPIRDDQGNILGVVEAIRDITPRMRMEEQLRETRARLNMFIDTAPLFIYMKDEALRYKVVNRHALETLGLEESEVLGRTDRAILPESAAAILEGAERKALRSGKIVRTRGVLPLPGRDMYFSATCFPVRQDGQVIGLFGLIEDTTELHDSEEALHRKEAQLSETRKHLEGIMENSRDMIFLTDPQGQLLSFNAGAERILGYPRAEVLGTPAARLADDPEGFGALLRTALREGHANQYEVPFRRRDGERVHCNIGLTSIDDPEGGPVEIVGICRDITTRLRLREDLIRSERLAAIGKMAAGVAHEINNPLAVIATIAGVLSDTCAEESERLPAECRETLEHAVERLQVQVRRATNITHSLLGFVRKSNSGRQPVDVAGYLEDSLRLLASELNLAQVEVERDYEPDLPRPVTDPMLLQQVFVNLIKNAIDAVEERGGGGRIRLQLRRDGDLIEVRIEDDGVGIPPEALGKIFDLFHTSKPAGKGTGLGLAIVHDIVERLGAEIHVDSEVGRWTRFTLRLPLTPPDPGEGTAPEGPEADDRPGEDADGGPDRGAGDRPA